MMPSGMVTPLRVLINDLDSPPVYSDTRLSQVLAVAAQQVQRHLSFSTTYVVDYTNLTITPDPTTSTPTDEDFIVLVTLKAACFVDTNLLRDKSATAGLRAVLGPMSLDTINVGLAISKLIEFGPCAMFEDMAKDYAFGNINILKAVLSPFINNQFDPCSLRGNGTNFTRRDGNSLNDPIF